MAQDQLFGQGRMSTVCNMRVASEYGVEFSRELMCPGWPIPIACVPKYWPQVMVDTSQRCDRHPCVYPHCTNINPYTTSCCSTCTMVDNKIKAYHPNCLKSHKFNVRLEQSDTCDHDSMFNESSTASLKLPQNVGISLILPEQIPGRCEAYDYKVVNTRPLNKGRRNKRNRSLNDENDNTSNVQADIPCEMNEL